MGLFDDFIDIAKEFKDVGQSIKDEFVDIKDEVTNATKDIRTGAEETVGDVKKKVQDVAPNFGKHLPGKKRAASDSSPKRCYARAVEFIPHKVLDKA